MAGGLLLLDVDQEVQGEQRAIQTGEDPRLHPEVASIVLPAAGLQGLAERQAEAPVEAQAEHQVEVAQVEVAQAVHSSGHQGVRDAGAATVKNSSQWIFLPIRLLALRCQKA